MSLNHPYQNENYSPAYQISAMPFLTSSMLSPGEVREIDFKWVSRFINIKNLSGTGNVLALGFTQNGFKPSNANYFIVPPNDQFWAEIRCTKIFLSASLGTPEFSVLGGLTMIRDREFTAITGSNGYPGVG
jgi:hypothetical protein